MPTQLVLGLALAVGAPALKPAPTPAEPNPLVGEWSLETWMFNGAYIPNLGEQFEFTTDGKFRSWRNDRTLGTGSYELVPKVEPAGLDWTDETETRKGIYKVDGDTLTVCLSNDAKGERPTEFTARLGSNRNLLTLKRVPAAKKE
jgi:uncharacterized protein (TIGR03067 family)